MIIRVLDSLSNRQQWIDFCRRERPYCFIRDPDSLVDFQSSHLLISLLNNQVRHGQQAIKYSIGSRHSIAPAWHFIKACDFDLPRMVELLQSQAFEGNARDNSRNNARLGLRPDISIRKFFAKERALISPSFLGPLEPLLRTPDFWDLHSICRVLANQQFTDLRCDSPDTTAGRPGPSTESLLLALVEAPEQWQIQRRAERLYIFKDRRHLFSLEPQVQSPQPRLTAF
ncbi:MAG: hypothetical protein ACJAWL_002799 [Motiliproteus sp.]|jgi:hypothetical protein